MCTQAVINISDDALWNLLSSCSNTGALALPLACMWQQYQPRRTCISCVRTSGRVAFKQGVIRLATAPRQSLLVEESFMCVASRSARIGRRREPGHLEALGSICALRRASCALLMMPLLCRAQRT